MYQNESIEELNQKFSVLFENHDGGILVENIDKQTVFINKKFCEYFSIQIDPESLIGTKSQHSAEIIKTFFCNQDKFTEGFEKILREKKSVYSERFIMTNGMILERDYIPVFEKNIFKRQIWIYRDISKYFQIENSLKNRLTFEELLTDISFSFSSTNVEELSKTINHSLEKIGQFINSDRVYVFQFTNEHSLMSNIYEWCSTGISSEMKARQNLPIEKFPGLMNKLFNYENIIIHSVHQMPDEAREEKVRLESQGIKSILIVPLIFDNDLFGYVGFDSINNSRKWDTDSIKFLGVFGNLLSSTIKRKESQEALIESQKKYKSVIDNVTEIIFQTDKEGLWTFLNPAWTTITGFTIDESIGENFLNYVHPDDRQRNIELFIPLINRKKEYCRHEIRYLRQDGTFCWIEVFAKLTLDENNEIIGTSGTLNDITKRKFQETEIKKLSKAVETTPSAFILTELDGKIIFVNNGLLKMGNYSYSSEILGKSIFEFTDDKGVELLKNKVLPELFSGKDWKGELNAKMKDNKIIPVNMVCSIIRDEAGQPMHLAANFYDISEMKKAEIDIYSALVKERELNELKSRFISVVSHEFRNPLSVILSSTEILQMFGDRFSQDKKDIHFQKIKTSIDNLLDILNEISEINRIDSGKVKIQPTDIYFSVFLKEILEEVKINDSKNPEVIINSNDEIKIFIDKKLLRQIIMNLISNALKVHTR